MQTLLQFGGGFFNWLWRASWQASVLVLLVLAVQWALRTRLSARARHALWLLVLVRLMLPWSVETRLSVFNWLPASVLRFEGDAVGENGGGVREANPAGDAAPAAQPETLPAPGGIPAASVMSVLGMVWLAGALAMPLLMVAGSIRLTLKARSQRPITDAAVLNMLEDCKEAMGVRTPLSLIETPAISCPALLGWVRPRLLLPKGFTAQFSRDELRHVFLHELGHVKRGDIALNWLAAIPLMLHWFNPLVWFSFYRMRADGEVACDALALRHAGSGENQSYGRTIIKLLESFSCPAVGPGMAGILENKNQMRRRISMIAKFKNTRSWPMAAGTAFAVLAVVALTDARPMPGAGTAGATADPKSPPQIVSTTPKAGAAEVDPNLSEITVTFDRDMQSGFSWTGGGPDYPPTQPGKRPVWKNKRTCALPVKLEAAHYYRVGINSTSYQNFRSTAGVPTKPSAIYFTTKGASEELKQKASVPRITSLAPKNGDQDVDPGLREIRVTFSAPMGPGCSWTGGGEHFPAIPAGQKPYWTDDKMTCVLPVELKPGWDYHLGINSLSHRNFQSAGGVPSEPVAWSFKTRQ